jgi:hypothetical protein
MSKIEVNTVAPQCGTTLTLGESGDTVTLGTGASQSGFGRTGTVDWDTTPKTGTFTAVSGDGFFCDTSSGGFTANLPAGVAGAIVSFADYAGTWDTGNLTVSPNGTDKIGGVNADVVLNTEGQSVTFVFADSTQGWINVQDSTSNERANAFIAATGGTITCSGNCRIHTFTGPGTFCVSAISPCAANNLVSYMVVAGGGGGGGTNKQSRPGSAAGAGGFREVKSPVTPYTASPLDGYPSSPNRVTVTATGFPIAVGGGGAGGVGTGGTATSGAVSTFSTITSAGGGSGSSPSTCEHATGGSGGAGRAGGPAGKAGNTPPVSPPQGNAGGDGGPCGVKFGTGGGGGATVAGSNGSTSAGGAGGAGATTSINGTPTAFAGGGGGSIYGPGTIGAAGTGGGAAGIEGNPADTSNGGNGTANTGGGASGAAGAPGFPSTNMTGGAGGSGIVIIRYKFQ